MTQDRVLVPCVVIEDARLVWQEEHMQAVFRQQRSHLFVSENPCEYPGCPSVAGNISVFCVIAHSDDRGRFCLFDTNYTEIPASLYP